MTQKGNSHSRWSIVTRNLPRASSGSKQVAIGPGKKAMFATDGWRRKSRQIQRLAEGRKTVLWSQTSARIQQNVVKIYHRKACVKSYWNVELESAGCEDDGRNTWRNCELAGDRSSQTATVALGVPWAFRCHLYDREAKSIGQQLSAHGRKIKKIVETRDVAKWTFGNGARRAAILERKMRTNFGGRDRR